MLPYINDYFGANRLKLSSDPSKFSGKPRKLLPPIQFNCHTLRPIRFNCHKFRQP
jgi:hypothetical protein